MKYKIEAHGKRVTIIFDDNGYYAKAVFEASEFIRFFADLGKVIQEYQNAANEPPRAYCKNHEITYDVRLGCPACSDLRDKVGE